MSGWWSLPRAAPILLRHLSAYAELAERDLAVAQRQIGARLVAIALILVTGLFTLLFIGGAIIAATWDTPQRMIAFYWMIGVFAAMMLMAIGYLSRINSQSDSLFGNVKREWAIDRVLLDRLLADGQRDRAERNRAAGHPGAGHPGAGHPAARADPGEQTEGES